MGPRDHDQGRIGWDAPRGGGKIERGDRDVLAFQVLADDLHRGDTRQPFAVPLQEIGLLARVGLGQPDERRGQDLLAPEGD